MIQVYAPHPDAESILVLPTPEFGDGERPESRIQIKQAMSGRLQTHVTQKQLEAITYRWSFVLTRMKALELWEFINLHVGKSWRIAWTGRPSIVAVLKVNPLQLNVIRRSVIAGSLETVTIDLEFESIE